MSGGSFDYLCDKTAEELFDRENTLELMFSALLSADAEDAAAETEDLVAMIRQCRVRIEVRRRRLEKVWHAMEWWRSGDWGESQFKEALAKYRTEVL